jgi:hypothetical protein
VAKVVGPAMSIDARGQLGKAIIYQGRPGGTIVTRYKVPRDPKTAAQRCRRTLFDASWDTWCLLSQEEKDYWNDLAKGQCLTGYNLWVQYICSGRSCCWLIGAGRVGVDPVC